MASSVSCLTRDGCRRQVRKVSTSQSINGLNPGYQGHRLKAMHKNSRQIVHDMRQRIRELLLISDGLVGAQPNIAHHLRIAAHSLMEDVVGIKEHVNVAREIQHQPKGRLFDIRSRIRKSRNLVERIQKQKAEVCLCVLSRRSLVISIAHRRYPLCMPPDCL